MNGVFRVPQPVNEPVRAYGPGSPEKKSIKAKLRDGAGNVNPVDITAGFEVTTKGTMTGAVVLEEVTKG